MSAIVQLRANFHQRVCSEAIFVRANNVPSIADGGSKLSVVLSQSIIQQLGYPLSQQSINGQTAGASFERIVKEYLESSIDLLSHLRPARWIYSVQTNISQFVQYHYLSEIDDIIRHNKEMRTVFGDYYVKPDVVIGRTAITDDEINLDQPVVDDGNVPRFTPLRLSNQQTPLPLLHASISCKLTMRSDRSQNARTEALNLIRQRKGHTPHIAVVTAEPMPTRLASIALGTGDIDCVYHFALHELIEAADETQNEAVIDSLNVMIAGNRLRDIADLPFDLIV